MTSVRESSDLLESRLRSLLVDTLVLWGVSGVVSGGEGQVAAVVNAESGTIVWIERPATDDTPFRWLVRWRIAGEAPGGAREQRPRGCGSLLGVLKALRSALGVERGSALRVAPAPVVS